MTHPTPTHASAPLLLSHSKSFTAPRTDGWIDNRSERLAIRLLKVNVESQKVDKFERERECVCVLGRPSIFSSEKWVDKRLMWMWPSCAKFYGPMRRDCRLLGYSSHILIFFFFLPTRKKLLTPGMNRSALGISSFITESGSTNIREEPAAMCVLPTRKLSTYGLWRDSRR